jgi:UDP-2-acetamido-2,6-beta-L-arabino-hexul-4-ose reductase
MRGALVTGSNGFIGKNLCVRLRRRDDIQLFSFDIENRLTEIARNLEKIDFVFHLAGVNRPKDVKDFAVNASLTREIVRAMERRSEPVPIVLSSSIQADYDNPYGRSKKEAEEELITYSKKAGVPVYIFRLPNVFGKWSRANYNSVVATFCYNAARGHEIRVDDASKVVEFAYVDDVVERFVALMENGQTAGAEGPYVSVPKRHKITVGELAERIVSFKEIRSSRILPDLSDPLTKHLYSTYLSYCDESALNHEVELKKDSRGWLFELLKSEQFGQIFISKTEPGITRGNHYHDSKIEKFCVIKGRGKIRLRSVIDEGIITYLVSGHKIEVVDIPPGFTHSIENCGDGEMITIFWANEIFDAGRPDTYFEKV